MMPVEVGQSLSNQRQKRLNGIYWKTFVGFVNKDGEKITEGNNRNEPESHHVKPIHRREGSFEYMELTPKDNASDHFEDIGACSSPEILITAPPKNEASMYAVLDMSKKKEIQINDEVAIFEGSPIKRHSFTIDVSSIPTTPKCSPILHVNGLLINDDKAPSPIPGKYQRSSAQSGIDKDEAIFTDTDDVPYVEDISYTDSDESEISDTFDSYSPSLEPAPWKDQSLSIQRWMVPHVIPENDDELNIPDVPPGPEFEFSHYVPTLEAILEESDEWVDTHAATKPRAYHKSRSTSDYQEGRENRRDVPWHSTSDLLSSDTQDDSFSITSTCGSIGSMRRLGTFENLSIDEDAGDETDESYDELIKDDENVVTTSCDVAVAVINDKTDGVKVFNNVTKDFKTNEENSGSRGNNHENQNNNSPELVPEYRICEVLETSPKESHITQTTCLPKNDENSDDQAFQQSCETDIHYGVDDLELKTQSEIPYTNYEEIVLDSTSDQTKSINEVVAELSVKIPTNDSTKTDVAVTELGPRDSGVDDVMITSASSRTELDDDESPMGSEINIPGLPKELYFDSRDIPKIVVMFAREELAKERARSTRSSNSEASEDAMSTVQYRKRSSTFDPEGFTDSAYSSRDGVQKRISQLRANEASRLSTLSSSTPELSAMAEDVLPYIPVSYASEAAERRKKKRRATMSAAEASKNKGVARMLQTKTIIGGSGFGSGFGSLRKRLKSKKKAGSGLRRSQSEKPQVSRASPDLSSPMARFLNSPRRRRSNKEKSGQQPGIEGRSRGIRSAFSNLFRRISLRFSSRNPSTSQDEDKNDNAVVEKDSPARSSLGIVTEESNTSESPSKYSSARESLSTPTMKNKSTDMTPQRSKNDSVLRGYDDFRQRSYSVPRRVKSKKSPKIDFPSTESDVFESAQNLNDENSLDKTIYV